MKVALLKLKARHSGGLEKYCSRIFSAFSQKGAEVTYLSGGSDSGEIDPPYIKNFSLGRWPKCVQLELFDKAVSKWLKTHPYDIVFGMERNRRQTHLRAGNGVHASYLKSRLASEGKLKYSLCHINPLHRKILQLEKSAFEYPGLRKIFVNSRMVKEQILEYYQADPSKIEVIHNGVEWHEFELPFTQWQNKRKEAFINYGLDPNIFHLLFIGNGYRRKGLDALLLAISKWKFSDLHLSVIGNDKNIERYRFLVDKLGLTKRVRFFGPQKNVIPFYQMADALAIPSFYDPFANVTIEALCFGLFVVSSYSNGGHEVLHKETSALIEDLQQTESIIEALKRAILHPKTTESATFIRKDAAHFDFSIQLPRLIDACL